MIQQREKTVSQIKKLIALAGNNPSHAEAHAAMLMAQTLMAKHDLHQKDVECEHELEVYETPVATECRYKIPFWQKALMRVIARNFKCGYYYQRRGGKRRIVIVGLEDDTRVCLLMVEFAFAHYKNSWASFLNNRKAEDKGLHTRSDTKIKKNDFTSGFVVGMKEAFEKNVQEKGLIIVHPDQVIQRMKSLKLTTVTTRPRKSLGDAEAKHAGYIAGLNAKRTSDGAITQR